MIEGYKIGYFTTSCYFQEFGASLKVVKVETDGNPSLVDKYKVWLCPLLEKLSSLKNLGKR